MICVNDANSTPPASIKSVTLRSAMRRIRTKSARRMLLFLFRVFLWQTSFHPVDAFSPPHSGCSRLFHYNCAASTNPPLGETMFSPPSPLVKRSPPLTCRMRFAPQWNGQGADTGTHRRHHLRTHAAAVTVTQLYMFGLLTTAFKVASEKDDVVTVSTTKASSDSVASKVTDANGFHVNLTCIEECNGEKEHILSVAATGAEPAPTENKDKDKDGIGDEEEILALSNNHIWDKRGAKSVEEGIRRIRTAASLPSLLSGDHDEHGHYETKPEEKKRRRRRPGKRRRKYAARTIAGLIVALADEAHDLEVEVDAQHDTPLWRKRVDSVKINFSRLGFKPLRMGGLDQALKELNEKVPAEDKVALARSLSGDSLDHPTADEAFDTIDADNSGALDQQELTKALNNALGKTIFNLGVGQRSMSRSTKELMGRLAARLMSLYDADGDQELDREEYQKMVQDMAALRRDQRRRALLQARRKRRRWTTQVASWLAHAMPSLRSNRPDGEQEDDDLSLDYAETVNATESPSAPLKKVEHVKIENESPPGVVTKDVDFDSAVDVSGDASFIDNFGGEGSIILSNLKLDLRRLLFGGFPVVKNIVPGGPLILEPFTVKATGSFNKDDIMDSALLDAGLRRLVARALQRRVRSFRDLLDGAVFYGRTWNMASKEAPQVEVDEITSIEFDKRDKIIITGRARVRTAPGAPAIENSFKLRTKFGTRRNGHAIRLKDPELALILECPKAWERNIVKTCKQFNWPVPVRPESLYTYFPLVSPLKVTESDGFYLGEDNCIREIEIKNGALRFELSAVLRPGRFLGNHYVAFTIPNRTFIITMDRVREGIRAARQNKRAKKAAARAAATELKKKGSSLPAPSPEEESLSFIERKDAKRIQQNAATTVDKESSAEAQQKTTFLSRFVRGYMDASEAARDEEWNDKLTSAVSEWFGRQEMRDGVEAEEELDAL